MQHPDGSRAVGVRLLASKPDGKTIDSWTMREPATSQRMTLPLGEVVLEVRRNDAVLTRRTLQVSEQNPPLEMVIDERVMVAGRLLDAQGAPVADWFVVAFADAEPNKERWFEAAVRLGFPRTGVDGTFSLWGPADGPLTVVARREGTSWRDAAPQITARNVAAGTSALTLRLPDEALQHATLAGSVVDTAGALLDDAVLMVQLSSDRNLQPLGTDGGRFRIDGFDLGHHRILVHAPDHASRSIEVTLSEPETTLPPIELQRSVPLRVRPVLPATPPWRGPLPRPIVRDADGAIVAPHPQVSVDGDTLQLHGLPAGRFVLHAPERDALTAEPLPIELLPGVPLEIEWPVRVAGGGDR
ncbi:MAG: carboxypeptidase regulatory-like domain-containing protein [Planctomycetes bacterium]|nr:carboxypeptidase regulatory-like domain-containing protein [Planctomycetota bacterium]